MALTPQLSQRLSEAIAQFEAGRHERAEAICRQLAALAPRVAMVFELWARIVEQQGRLDEAIRHYQHALQLEPRSVSRAVQLAGAQIAAGLVPEAEKTLRRFTVEQPRSCDAWNALGFALKLQGRLDEAVACHERAVQINPKFAQGWLHWGLTLTLAGRNHWALEKYERALALDPRLISARYGRAQVLHKTYRTAEAIEDYDAVIKADPQNLEARSYRLFALQSRESISRDRLFAEHRAYGERVGRGPAVLPGCDYSPDKRLRVAVLSPDFRTHSCAYFIEPMLRGLDPAHFEIYLYHDHFQEDEITASFRGLASGWRKVVGQAPAVFERVVRADRPDILIDLTGHVGNTIRLPSLAKRLAPVQITYLGYPDTTGVPAMDYRFTDAIADPPGEADAFATEKLVRFAPVAWTYQPPMGAPAVSPSPCAASGVVTFGCFSSPTKFTDSLLSTWARLLAAVPGAKLLLKADFDEETGRQHMKAWLARQGIPAERVELLPRTPDAPSHLALYARVDVALDTFPYTGTTTTCEAMYMGRPVITLCGDRHAARVGASLLHAVGRPQWIAQDVDDYVARAVSLVSDTASLARESSELRGAMERSRLMDASAQAESFAAALRACWVERSQIAQAAATT